MLLVIVFRVTVCVDFWFTVLVMCLFDLVWSWCCFCFGIGCYLMFIGVCLFGFGVCLVIWMTGMIVL